MALQRLVEGRVEIYFLPPEHSQSLKGSLAAHIKTQVSPGEDWDEAREAAWEQAARIKEGTREPES